MTTWLLDLGNTRLKYAPLVADGQLGAVHAVAHDDAEAWLKQIYGGRRVLLVEDEPVNQEIACMLLEDVDLLVEPSVARPEVRGFALMPANPAPFVHTDSWDASSTDKATPDRLLVNLNKTTVTSPGDLTIYGGISGKSGTVTSEGSVKLLAGRTLKMEHGASKEPQEEEEEE